MVAYVPEQSFSPNSYKNEQNDAGGVHTLPTSALLVDIIRPIENRLEHRGLLQPPTHFAVNPFWFLAETECDVYLWQHGHSLNERPSFEFWIDCEGLVAKRIGQLRNAASNQCVVNSVWSMPSANSEAIEAEINYLKAFIDLLNQIASHAAALGHVSSIIASELGRSQKDRTIIILPSSTTS